MSSSNNLLSILDELQPNYPIILNLSGNNIKTLIKRITGNAVLINQIDWEGNETRWQSLDNIRKNMPYWKAEKCSYLDFLKSERSDHDTKKEIKKEISKLQREIDLLTSDLKTIDKLDNLIKEARKGSKA